MAERPLGFRPPAHAGGEANPSVEGGARSPPQSGSAFLFVMLLLFVLNSGGGGGGGETLIGSGGGGSGGRKEPARESILPVLGFHQNTYGSLDSLGRLTSCSSLSVG
jgi:hypothetical protein